MRAERLTGPFLMVHDHRRYKWTVECTYVTVKNLWISSGWGMMCHRRKRRLNMIDLCGFVAIMLFIASFFLEWNVKMCQFCESIADGFINNSNFRLIVCVTLYALFYCEVHGTSLFLLQIHGFGNAWLKFDVHSRLRHKSGLNE